MCTRQTLPSSVPRPLLMWRVSSAWVSLVLLPGLLGFCVMLSLLLPIQVTHYQQKQEVEAAAAAACSGSGLWLQARPLVADGEAFMRRPLESPEE